MIQLRPVQEADIEAVRNSFRSGKVAPLLVAPTGYGKTVVFSYLAQASSLRGNSVLILVHRIELLKQTSSKLMAFGVDHGLVNPRFTPAYGKPIQAASVQSLIKRLNKANFNPDLIIIDEAHHAVAGTWKKIIDHYPNSKILGVTATPCRASGEGLGDIFDDMIIGPTVQELIDLEYLVPARVFAPTTIDTSKVSIVDGEYNQKELRKLMGESSITGSAVESTILSFALAHPRLFSV